MDNDSYKVVYDKTDIAINALLLVKGELVFTISDKSYFTVKGENIIFGAGEVLYGFQNEKLETRKMKVYKKKGAEIKKIQNDNLKNFIGLYNIGFNITKFMAKCLDKTNQIITDINQNLILGNNSSRRYYKFYFNIISRIKKIVYTKKNEILLSFINEKKETLAYRKGKIFSDIQPDEIEVEPKKLDEFLIEYEKDIVICNQHEISDEMYILNSGKVNVVLNNEVICSISKKGAVLGEMSLFLNEPRSASLIAAEKSVITVIKKDSLQLIADKMPDIFFKITTTLWERLKNNIAMIQEIEKLNSDKARMDLRILSEELVNLYKSEKLAWLLTLKEEIDNAL